MILHCEAGNWSYFNEWFLGGDTIINDAGVDVFNAMQPYAPYWVTLMFDTVWGFVDDPGVRYVRRRAPSRAGLRFARVAPLVPPGVSGGRR